MAMTSGCEDDTHSDYVLVTSDHGNTDRRMCGDNARYSDVVEQIRSHSSGTGTW